MSLPLSFDKSFNRIVEDINLHTSFDRNKNIYLLTITILFRCLKKSRYLAMVQECIG